MSIRPPDVTDTEGRPQLRSPSSQWRSEQDDYLDRVTPWVERRRYRRSRGLKHPVEDFIWEYYSLRGGRMLQWCPGADMVLEEASEEEFPERDGYRLWDGGRILDAEACLSKRESGVRWILNLLQQTRDREPLYSCLGLHEWAMVYDASDVRHDQVPLRLSHAETRRVVETLPLQCTHYDAFRFFSTDARPFNPVQLEPEDRPRMEQPACLHANMDLFKWCMKLQPLVPSRLTLQAFDLACSAREVDMRASPYDLRGMGYEPICIETPEGRKQYVEHQKRIEVRSSPVRDDLIQVLERLIQHTCAA